MHLKELINVGTYLYVQDKRNFLKNMYIYIYS